MSENTEPVVLELAPLPREQIGPFLLLGIEKDADLEQIESSWATRLKQARRRTVTIGLEDINWAREVLKDPDRRVRADAGSLNADTSAGVLRQLAERFGGKGSQARWQPLDREKDLRHYSPSVELPDADTVRAAISVPPPRQELPAVRGVLEALANQAAALDPWSLNLAEPSSQEFAP